MKHIAPGQLWRFTAKGIKSGEDKARVLAVVYMDPEGYAVAWKCTELPSGKLSHPAYKRPLARNDARLFCKSGRNGSAPTAVFKPDSFYVQEK